MDSNKKPASPENGGNRFNGFWIYGVIILTFLAINMFTMIGADKKQLTQNRLEQMIRDADIEKIEVVNNQKALIYIKKGSLSKYSDIEKSNLSADRHHYFIDIGNVEVFSSSLKEVQEKAEIPRETWVHPAYVTKTNWIGPILNWVLPVFILIAIWLFIMKRVGGGGGGPGGQIFNIGKSKATLFDQNSKVNVTFADVAGLDEAKVEVMEVVDFLKTPKKYTALGGKIPKGVLLVGPPGTGKTFI